MIAPSKDYVLVRRADNVITDEGNKKAMHKKRIAAGPGVFYVGVSFSKTIGDTFK